MRLFRSHLLFKIGLYATAIHLSTTPRNSGIPFVKSKCHRLSAQPYRVLFSTWAVPPNRTPNPENAVGSRPPRYSSIRSLLRIGASLVACTDYVQLLALGFSLHKKVRRTPLNSSLITHLSSHTAAPCAALRRGSAATMDRRFTTNSATERNEKRQEIERFGFDGVRQAPPRCDRW